jgi:ABC-type sugar transport system permease subunit
VEKYRRRLIVPFLAPGLLVIVVFFLVPAVMTVRLSFLNWYGTFQTSVFVGWQNYLGLLSDRLFLQSVRNTFVYFGLSLVLLFPIALFLAWALGRVKRGRSFYQFMIFAPAVLSVAVVGVMWKFILNPNFGLVNEILRAIGLGSLARPWLGDPSTAMLGIVVTIIWHGIATWIILLMAGMDRIPPELAESARVDGASEWQVYRRITLPLLWPVLSTLLVLWFIQAMQAFAFIYVMTQGGPAGATEVMGTYLYRVAFEGRMFSAGAAMAVVMTLIVLLVSVLGNRLLRRQALTY